MDVEEYILSGIIESYVLGLLSEEEEIALKLKAGKHKKIVDAIESAEIKIEQISLKNALMPPASLWQKIQEQLV